MELLNFLRTLRRDWWVILLVVALTVGGIGFARGRMTDRYEATSVYALAFPVRPPTPQEVVAEPKLAKLRVDNPMLNYDNRGTVTEILIGRLGSNQVRSVMAGRGVRDYRVDLESTRVVGSGSLLFNVVSTGATPEQALRGSALLRQQAATVLRSLQGPAAKSATYQITLADVSLPTQAQKAVVDQIRVLAAIALMGLLVLLAALSVRSALWAARLRRRAGADREIEPLGSTVAARTDRDETDRETTDRETTDRETTEHHAVREAVDDRPASSADDAAGRTQGRGHGGGLLGRVGRPTAGVGGTRD